MKKVTPRLPAEADTLRLRQLLLVTFDGLEKVCHDLGCGQGIAHDPDRAGAIEQLRAAQELIRGVGLRLREEAGL